jgi:hypothetical protein
MKRNTVSGNKAKTAKRRSSGFQRRGEGGHWGQAVLKTLHKMGGEAEGGALMQGAASALKAEGIGGTKAIHLDVTLERLVEAGLVRVGNGGTYKLSSLEMVRQGGGDDSGNRGKTFYSTDFTTQVDRDWAALAGSEAA